MSLPVATHKGPVNITHLGGREVGGELCGVSDGFVMENIGRVSHQ